MMMFVSKFVKAASTMLLELIVNVGSIRIDRQKEAVDNKCSKCQRIYGFCFQKTATYPFAFARYQMSVAIRFRMVLCRDFEQRIDLEQNLKTQRSFR